MRALVIVGHGSLRQASGAAMIRLAALARRSGLVPITTPGFLNFSQPTFADAVARAVRKGATEVIVQPYFLISGYYVERALPKLVEEAQRSHPHLQFRVASAFGYHPALSSLVQKRVAEAERVGSQPRSLLLMAHGTPYPEANAAIYRVADDLERRGGFLEVVVAFMELNQPSIPEAVAELSARGGAEIVATPYFLQLGGHVAEDLPKVLGEAQERHPHTVLTLTEYLGYDEGLLEVVRDRIGELG